MALIRLRGQLEQAAGGSEHQIDGERVIEVLQGLEQSNAALDGWILDERGQIRPHINVFVGDEQADADTPVGPDDKIEILPAISGG